MKFKATDLLGGKVKVTVEIVEMPITDLLKAAGTPKEESFVGPFGKSDKDEENRLLESTVDRSPAVTRHLERSAERG